MTNRIKKKKLRVGVIGLGNMGKNHVRILSNLPTVELVAICDANEQLLKSTTLKTSATPYTDYQEMLEKEQIDMVSVVVPAHLHYQIAKDSLERGIHTLVEKPFVLDMKEGQELIKKAKKADVVLGVGHVERFNPALTELKKRLLKNEGGSIIQIMIRRIGPFPERILDVGVIMDLATHDIDILRFLSESEVKSLSAQAATIIKNNHHEDTVMSLISFKNGILASITENWLSPTKIRDLMINCQKGMFYVDLISQDLYFYENNYAPSRWQTINEIRGMSEGNMIRFSIPRDEPLKLELSAFVYAAQTNSQFLTSGQDGLLAVKLANQLLENTKSKNGK